MKLLNYVINHQGGSQPVERVMVAFGKKILKIQAFWIEKHLERKKVSIPPTKLSAEKILQQAIKKS